MKSPYRLGLMFTCALAIMAWFWVRPPWSRDVSGSRSATEAAAAADQPSHEDGPRRLRENRSRRGGNAPSDKASDAVAALVGNSSLSDLEVVAGLRLLVDDAARPIAERLEALGHVLNLVSNDNPGLLHEIAAGRNQPAEVRRQIIAAALNRPPRLQGEMLVLQFEHAAGDERKEALVQLTGLCGEDLGEDLEAWRAAVAKLAADQ